MNKKIKIEGEKRKEEKKREKKGKKKGKKISKISYMYTN